MWKGTFGNTSKYVLKETKNCLHIYQISEKVQLSYACASLRFKILRTQNQYQKYFHREKNQLFLVLIQTARQTNLETVNSNDYIMLQFYTEVIGEVD